MFERFTPEAKAVLVRAQDAAINADSGFITPLHLLYGCAEGREGTAGEVLHGAGISGDDILPSLEPMKRAPDQDVGHIDPDALKSIGIDYEQVRQAVDGAYGDGALEASPDRRSRVAPERRPPFTPDAKRSMELSMRVALELHDRLIRPGHLLLGLLRLDNEKISALLDERGASVAGISAGVLMSLNP